MKLDYDVRRKMTTTVREISNHSWWILPKDHDFPVEVQGALNDWWTHLHDVLEFVGIRPDEEWDGSFHLDTAKYAQEGKAWAARWMNIAFEPYELVGVTDAEA